MSKRRCVSSCPLCIEGKKARAFHKGHFGYPGRAALKKVRLRMLRRKRAAEATQTPHVMYLVDGDELAERWPSLAEFLTAERFEDGTPRETGTLNLSYGDLRFRGCLNDREAGEYAFLSAVTLTALLDALEAALAADQVEWRRARKPAGKRT